MLHAPVVENGHGSLAARRIRFARNLSLLSEPDGHEAGAAVDAESSEDLADVLVRGREGLAHRLGDLLFAPFSEQMPGDLALGGREGRLGDE